MLDAGAHHRILGRGEWQLIDDHQAQGAPLYVHALPEARGPQQHRVAAGAESAQQLLARRASLDQQRPLVRQLAFQNRSCGTQRAMAGEQQERAAAGSLDQRPRRVDDGGRVP